MFNFATTELLLIAVVALVVIGPKQLPEALRAMGRFVGKARAMAGHVRSGFDEMVRQAELDEMDKRWAEHNRRIMDGHPGAAPAEAHPAGEMGSELEGVEGADDAVARPDAAPPVAGAFADPLAPAAPPPEALPQPLPEASSPTGQKAA